MAIYMASFMATTCYIYMYMLHFSEASLLIMLHVIIITVPSYHLLLHVVIPGSILCASFKGRTDGGLFANTCTLHCNSEVAT